jgi:hypothetical protein
VEGLTPASADDLPLDGRAYTCLMVALYVTEPAIVNLTVHDHVQLDRVTRTSAERYGDLLPPGTTPVHLAAGTYVFCTTGDAHVQLGEDMPVHVLAVTLRRSHPEDRRPRRVGRLSRPRARAARSPPRRARPQ